MLNNNIIAFYKKNFVKSIRLIMKKINRFVK